MRETFMSTTRSLAAVFFVCAPRLAPQSPQQARRGTGRRLRLTRKSRTPRRRPVQSRTLSSATKPHTCSSMTTMITKRESRRCVRWIVTIIPMWRHCWAMPAASSVAMTTPSLVRAGARRRSQSRGHLVVLRDVASRARQYAQGQGRSGESAFDLRHRVPRLPNAQEHHRRHRDLLNVRGLVICRRGRDLTARC
jgi:hypothetical protein